jgi:hypothetical protein
VGLLAGGWTVTRRPLKTDLIWFAVFVAVVAAIFALVKVFERLAS